MERLTLQNVLVNLLSCVERYIEYVIACTGGFVGASIGIITMVTVVVISIVCIVHRSKKKGEFINFMECYVHSTKQYYV